jgi:hypothetical protein
MLCGQKFWCRFEIAAAGFLQDQQALIYPRSANSRGTSEIAIGYPGSPGIGKKGITTIGLHILTIFVFQKSYI